MIFHLGEVVPRRRGPKTVTGPGQLYLCPRCAKREAKIHQMSPGAPYVTISKKAYAVCAFCGRQLKQRIGEEPRTRYRQTTHEMWRSRQDHDPFVREIRRRIREGDISDDMSDDMVNNDCQTLELCAKYLSILNERQRACIMYRYGIDHSRPHTLTETGEKYKVSRERVRQIIARGLREMQLEARNDTVNGC